MTINLLATSRSNCCASIVTPPNVHTQKYSCRDTTRSSQTLSTRYRQLLPCRVAVLDEQATTCYTEPLDTTTSARLQPAVGDSVVGTVEFSNTKGARIVVKDYNDLRGYMPDSQGPVATKNKLRNQPGVAPVPVLPTRLCRPFKVLGVPEGGHNAGRSVLLSAYRYDLDLMWKRAQQLMEVTQLHKETVLVKVLSVGQSGFMTKLCGLRAYIPFSQVLQEQGQMWTQKSGKSLVGKELEVAVVECDPVANRLMLSEREARQYKALKIVSVGALVWGTVNKVTSYGVHVAIDGTFLHALLHCKHISQSRIDNPGVVFATGERLRALVMECDVDYQRIALNTALLETQPGMILTDREQLYAGAEAQVAELHQRQVLQRILPGGSQTKDSADS